MPLYMDRHDVPGATAQDVAEAHMKDVELSAKHHVQFLSYWFDESVGGVFCFANAPSQDELRAVHEESHGLIPNEIISVSEQEMLHFLGAIHDPDDAGELTSPVRTVAFTDLVDSTSLLSQFGEARYVDLIGEHDSIVRRALIRHRGREIKHTGDGIMAAFDEVGDALAWAASCVSGFHARQAAPALSVRIGMATGIPVDRHNDIFGETVVLARRLCDGAAADRVLVSEDVHAAAGGLGFRFDGPRLRQLKGFPAPVTIFEVMLEGDGGQRASGLKAWWDRLTGRGN